NGHAELDRRPVEPVAWSGAALQAFAALFFVYRSWCCCRVGAIDGKYDVGSLRNYLAFHGIGFGPTAPLTQVALQNTVPVHDLGAALGSMNFVRTLVATIMIAIFGAIILANAPVGARGGTLSQSFLGSASMATFSVVFLAIAVTLAASFLSLFLLEEKPLAEA